VVEVIIKLNLLRSEGDKASPLMLQSFDFLTLYTQIDLMDLKSWMRVLINNFFHQMFKLHCFNIKCLLRSNTCPVVLHRLSMFIGLWMIFWFLIFQTLRISCT
jgi:hypothetical protein